MTSYQLFEDDRIAPAIAKAMKQAKRLGHKMTEFQDVEVKGAVWCKSAGCTHCGTANTSACRDKAEIVGDSYRRGCKRLSAWRRR